MALIQLLQRVSVVVVFTLFSTTLTNFVASAPLLIKPEATVDVAVGHAATHPHHIHLNIPYEKWHCGATDFDKPLSHQLANEKCSSRMFEANLCCFVHDLCYTEADKTQTDCDSAFCFCLRRTVAERVDTNQTVGCSHVANYFCEMVELFGSMAHSMAQRAPPLAAPTPAPTTEASTTTVTPPPLVPDAVEGYSSGFVLMLLGGLFVMIGLVSYLGCKYYNIKYRMDASDHATSPDEYYQYHNKPVSEFIARTRRHTITALGHHDLEYKSLHGNSSSQNLNNTAFTAAEISPHKHKPYHQFLRVNNHHHSSSSAANKNHQASLPLNSSKAQLISVSTEDNSNSGSGSSSQSINSD